MRDCVHFIIDAVFEPIAGGEGFQQFVRRPIVIKTIIDDGLFFIFPIDSVGLDLTS
jgi:hypothetical protein